MAKVFFSYSHADEELRNELEIHLAALKRQGLISAWHDRRIYAGQDFDREINVHLEDADIILFLISPNFIASDYCYNVEVKRALERRSKGEAEVLPVILRSCDWKDLPFGKLLAVPTDGKAVTKFADRDEAFLDIVKAIKRVLKGVEGENGTGEASTVAVGAPTGVRAAGGSDISRSSNLRVKRSFSDREKDKFEQEAFEYIANYFEESLAELERRNSGISTNFRRISANRFSATVYQGGKKVTQCSIWLADGSSGFSQGICYLYGDYMVGSLNDYLSVNDDGYMQYLQPVGMLFRSHGKDKKLSYEGAAEYYWGDLLSHMQ